ncbi:MAG: helix-turn-helix domain-containing protein, partial [bacterium]|nr:helix-turn-helix domain-containing protein [bacterium]
MFSAYDALFLIWKKRESQRKVSTEFGIGRDTIRGWEDAFLRQGAIGFLRIPGLVEVD